MSADTQQQGAAITPEQWFFEQALDGEGRGLNQYIIYKPVTPSPGYDDAVFVVGETSAKLHAAQIVRACNAYPALVAACEKANAMLEEISQFVPDEAFEDGLDVNKMRATLRAALAEAGR